MADIITSDGVRVGTNRGPIRSRISGLAEDAETVAADAAGGLSRFGSSTLLGLREDPLFRPLVDGYIRGSGGEPEAYFDQLENEVGSGTVADVGRIFGEYVLPFAASVATYSTGRSLGVKALQGAAKGQTTGQLGKVAARQISTSTGLPTAPKAGLEMATEIVSGSSALGGLEGYRKYLETEDPWEAAKTAGITAGLGIAGEGIIRGGLKAVGVGREVDFSKLMERHLASSKPLAAKALSTLDDKIAKQEMRVRKWTREMGMETELSKQSSFNFIQSTVDVERASKAAGLRLALDKGNLTLRNLRTQRSAIQHLDEEVVPAIEAMKRGGPLHEGQTAAILREYLKIGGTMDGIVKRSGSVSALKLLQQVQLAENQAILMKNVSGTLAGNNLIETRTALGLGRRGSKKTIEAVRKELDNFEKGNDLLDGRLAPLFDNVEQFAKQMDDIGRQHGVPLSLTRQELTDVGRARFFPQLVDYSKTDANKLYHQVLQAVPKLKPGATMDDALKVAEKAVPMNSQGLRQYGNLDIARLIPGTTAEKVAAGIPLIDDPFRAMAMHGASAGRRIAYSRSFGAKGEVLGHYKDLMAGEGLAPSLANALADVPVGKTYYNAAMSRYASMAVNTQISAKLTLAAIPNLFQSQNTLLMFGARKTLRGITTSVNPLARTDQEAVLSRALQHTITDVIHEGFVEPGLSTPMGRFAGFMMRATGFSFTERWNRTIAGMTAVASLADDVLRASQGTLRGNARVLARRRAASAGLDLETLARHLREDPNFMGTAAWRDTLVQTAFGAARTTQFLTDVTRKPTYWSSPVGRVMFQFKTFALQQAKFLREAVLEEAGHGNLKPLAYFLSVYPMTGELVGNARSLITQRDRPTDPGARVLEGYMNSGGFGIVSDMWMAARFSTLLESTLGPTFSDFATAIEDISQGDTAALIQDIDRQPFVRLAKLGISGVALTAEQIGQYAEERKD